MELNYGLGFRLPSSRIDLVEQMRIGEMAARMGYDTVLTSETWGFDAFTRLGYLAARTNVRLGTAIVPVHSRTPSLLAQAIGTLSRLSSGAPILGLGLSSPTVMNDWHGVEFEPALRHERETIEIVRKVLSGDPVEYDGHLFNLDFAPVRFVPPGDISIYLAAQGPTNVRLTGEFADGWMPTYIPLSNLEDARASLVEGARARGRDPDEVVTVPTVTTCVLEDGERARERCRETVAFYIGGMGTYHYRTLAENGYRERANRIRDAWNEEDYEAARAAVSDEILDEVALSGTPEYARQLLSAVPDSVDQLVTVPATRAPVEEIKATVRNVGEILDPE
ncbi:MAG: LLM class flavin-dependent oxidoreductase [Haloarcula sp.]